MAEAVVPVKRLDDVIECPICKELLTDPRTLPCTHTFCFKCIAEWSKDKQPKEAVSCPVCRKDFTVPDGGIQELPKNSFVVKLLTLRQLSETPTETELCDVCSEDDETSGRDRTMRMFSIDCQQRMCKLCSQSHSKMTASSHHRLVNRGEPLNDVRSQYPPASCDKHRDKYLEIYCFDCKSVVCMLCCVTQNTGHQYSDVGEVADSFRKEMVKDAETINGAIKSLDHKLKTLENAKKDFVKNIQTVETEICKKADELKSLIDLRKKQLLNEVAEVKSIRMKEINNVSCEIEKDKSLLDSFRVYCEELVKKGSPSDIAREADRLRGKAAEIVKFDSVVQPLPPANTVIIKFRSSDVLSKDMKNVVGVIVEEVTEVKQSIPTYVRTLDDVSRMVTAMALCDGELFVKRSRCAKISVYDTSTLEVRRQLTVAGLGDEPVFGMAACKINQYLYLSDKWNSVVYTVSLSAAYETGNSTKWSVMKEPAGLSVNRACNVLVASQDSQTIQEFTPNGSLVREIYDFCGLWHAVELNDGNLVVSRGKDVCIMTSEGQVIQSIAGSRETVAPFKNTRCLAVDRQGYILVVDEGTNRVLVVDPSLTEARELQLPISNSTDSTDFIREPLAICWDHSRGRIFVGESQVSNQNNRVLVFDNVANVGSMFTS